MLLGRGEQAVIKSDDLWRLVSPTCTGECWKVTTTLAKVQYHVTAPTRRSAAALAREYSSRFVLGVSARPRVIHAVRCREE